ncbi:hypothetical protein CYMTET_15063 [Cymbomonas tetramitiformis]|uniref:Exostosin GT47 domain-containing protein n=1 Tax=Cymbomonas tetramitiformis TaxID=36881 RepID=A0AAE0GER6_9CHLO|nr:hypothetical protein CYMTET_15063 [Cymbomonas tetramitiformis]
MDFEDQILHKLTNTFVLISNNNWDWLAPYVSETHLKRAKKARKTGGFPGSQLLESSKLIAWFSTNVVLSHPKLHPIPLGPKWQYFTTEFNGEPKQRIKSILDLHTTPSSEFLKQDRPYLIFVNFSVSSTATPRYAEHTGAREQCLKQLLDSGLSNGLTTSNKVFEASTPHLPAPSISTTIYHRLLRKKIVRHTESRELREAYTRFAIYLKVLQKFKFTLSPPGNGVDAHRTWEALLAGSVPIVIEDPISMHPLYHGLPVLMVRDCSEITERFLEEQYATLKRGSWNHDKLFMRYWRKVITKASL